MTAYVNKDTLLTLIGGTGTFHASRPAWPLTTILRGLPTSFVKYCINMHARV